MKVLITGGAGFIGSHLCQKMLEGEHKVVSLDNYSTGSKKNHIDGVTYIEGETKNIDKLIQFTPDVIYHFGEYSRVEQSFKDIDDVWESNMIGTFAVLKFCKKNKSKIIYAGSSTKFCNDCVGSNLSPYSFTKASNTNLVKNFSNWFGVKYAVVYFYNVYGAREISEGQYATLIAIFKQQYLNNKKLTVVLPGTQCRNFTYIDDVIEGITLVGMHGSGDGYGIGSDESFSILEIAQMFNREIEFLPERLGNRSGADLIVSKIQKLGWSAKTSIKDHISSFINN
jgi:UDP-glucose 4-epimerase